MSWLAQNTMVVTLRDGKITKDFLFALLRTSDLSEAIFDLVQPKITRRSLALLLIPLPPLDAQGRIAAEFEGYESAGEY